MSWTVNGITWTPQTASAHATTSLNYLNSLNVAPTLVASPTNAIWLNYLGVGGLQQNYDNKLYAASQSFNLATCDDTQVLNLAPITGTSPIPATYSTAYVNVTAASAGNATILAGAKIPFQSINFVVATTTTVPAGTTIPIYTVADTAGPYLALIGQLTSFSSSITNVQTVTNQANSSQGNNTETTPAFRQRLIGSPAGLNSNSSGPAFNIRASQINNAITAIRQLQGVISANMWFNSDTVVTMNLNGGATVAPRHAYIVIQGSDVAGSLANAYMSYMTAPTSGAQSENWISASGQSIPVYYDISTAQSIYVNLYYDPSMPTSSNWLALAAGILVALNNTYAVGQEVTAAQVMQALTGFTYASITSATVSLDGITYGRVASVPATKYALFATTTTNQVTGP